MKKVNNLMNVWTRNRCPFTWISLLLGAIALGLGGCDLAPSQEPLSSDPDRPTVVATSTILADWTEEIAGDAVNRVGILEPGADPHIYEPVPADTAALEDADLILYNGYNLEPALIRMIQATGIRAEILAVGEVVPPLELDKDGQTVPDPHVWGSAANAIPMVEAIRDALIALSPDDADRFRQNAEDYIQDLQDLHTWIQQQTATIPAQNRQLVTTHDAFQYYAHAYQLQVVGTLIGISTEEQPSAQTVSQLVEAVRATGVPTIFAETTINSRLIETVAEEAGVMLSPQRLYSDSIGAIGSEGDSYIKMMVSNTQAIVEQLGGQITTPYAPIAE